MKKMMFLMPALLFLSAASMNAQVLIGDTGNESPNAGAILDLHNTTDFKGGLLLPRVGLTNMNSLTDISDGMGNEEPLTGLVVYNTTSGTEGIYVWNGTSWVCVISFSSLRIISPTEAQTKITKKDGSSPELSITVDGDDAGLTYQWEGSSDSDMWYDIESANTNSYNVSTKNAGTFYYRCTVSNENQSVTSPVFTAYVCKSSVEIEKNLYCTGTFGDAGEWITMNLRPTTDNSSYPNNSESTFASHPEYGLLYTWEEATCPTDWHIPTNQEWAALVRILLDNPGVYSTGVHDTNVREPMLSKINVIYGTGGLSNSCATSDGFDGLLVGYITGGVVTEYGTETRYWESESSDNNNANYLSLTSNSHDAIQSSAPKTDKYSVRCKKN